MITGLYWLTLWTYTGFFFLARRKVGVKLADISLALPLGMALSGLVALGFWLTGGNFRLIGSIIEVMSVLLMVKFLANLPRPRQKWLGATLNRLRLWQTVTLPWPWAILAVAAAFSLAIIATWQIFVQPVTWDNLTLYDFRAQRLAQGWLLSNFYRQFPTQPAFAMYDFLHPFLPSILSAFVHKSGSDQTQLISLGLLLCVLHQAFLTWSRRTWGLFSVLLLATPLFFNSAVEGYAVWTATLFWLLSLLVIIRLGLNGGSNQLTVGILVAAAMQSRLSEPYWVPVIGYLLWRHRFLAVAPSLLLFGWWQSVVRVAGSFTQVGVVRSTYEVQQFLPTIISSLAGSDPSEVVVPLITQNPAIPYILGATVGWIWLKRTGGRKDLDWLMKLLVGWLMILVSGMTALYLWNPTGLGELVGALPRAGLPIAALSIVLLAAVYERLQVK